jgi:hypothetical protein
MVRPRGSPAWHQAWFCIIQNVREEDEAERVSRCEPNSRKRCSALPANSHTPWKVLAVTLFNIAYDSRIPNDKYGLVWLRRNGWSVGLVTERPLCNGQSKQSTLCYYICHIRIRIHSQCDALAIQTVTWRKTLTQKQAWQQERKRWRKPRKQQGKRKSSWWGLWMLTTAGRRRRYSIQKRTLSAHIDIAMGQQRH